MPRLLINGKTVDIAAEADMPLLWVLRAELKLTGTKYGCGVGICGACTVHLGDVAVRACTTKLADALAARQPITTIEGLAGREADALRKAFTAIDVVQCGYCQSGQLMSASALLKKSPRPTDAEIDAAMECNLCRCGTYPRIRAAIHLAAADIA